MRIYHNVSKSDGHLRQRMCRLYCDNDHVDLCDVRNLPSEGNFYKRLPIGRFWRFLPLGDPTVRMFQSRDIDSYISEREVEAVRDWVNSGEQFHVMRDHRVHTWD